ncbi:hypothetical protein DUNSADRAFT_7685 [Dunaliella salina]|uniref:RING-type domain-containing protein n=1 Tax=Dunaliella salina TaxID=3046 RepID=A0ABQ7H6C4_DUNSA|nr:hypothetical protein DUNSADRAFT_7685 [Dunaliella salina]|eukprot:KAF5842371.1 hypothetical protein DUNSADRAFT_7685 [Dunaliella salina]
MQSQSFQCNLCWLPLDTTQRHACTPCLHLYCMECVGKLLEASAGCCNVCSATLTRQNVKAVQVLQPAPKYQLALCGQTPEVIMQAALTAIKCYVQQNDLSGQFRENKLQGRMNTLHAQCSAKLQQVHQAYQKAKSKSAALAAQKASLEQENLELSSKYQQRSSQVAQLKEQVQALTGEAPIKGRSSLGQLSMQVLKTLCSIK